MQDPILVHRNDVPALRLCDSLLRGALEIGLSASLVEALFDYKPDAWYLECEPPAPPPRSAASQEARELLRRIGDYALASVELEPEQRSVVRDVLESLK